ncbi:MAG: chalcone isomerase family protein [Acidobacteria bacterium]|nr:chalcone isomerase family protein [Acidobacteriota bacterium]
MKTILYKIGRVFFSRNLGFLIFALSLVLVIANSSYAQTTKEKETGIEFSNKLSVAGKNYELVLASSITATFVFKFNVCAFAFYIEEGKFDKNKNLGAQLIEDGFSKYLVLHFVRDVKAKDIQDAYEENFKKMVTNYDDPKAKKVIEPFFKALTNVNKNEKMEYIWTTGGNVDVFIKSQKKYSFQNVLLAKLIWASYLQ